MRLKSVRIFGFKTFADPTEFALSGGIVAVVGPNGCGKSNIVDAILWGLGEPNSRHLRANNAQEVIFSGSSARKGVGYCEVSLLFDNEDGLLPLDSPEVVVSRRLSRTGDSDYTINRRSCRQRDVFELLADSGLGRTGYAIIGQRQIDAAVTASSEERRSWIDEAAGVQRYRQRKLEALRKLDGARDHLQRVNDILSELDSQREPLKEQAEQAAAYRRTQRLLTELEVAYLSFEAREALADQTRYAEQIEIGRKLIAAETFRATAHETHVAALVNEIVSLDRSMDSKRESEREEIANAARSDSEVKVQQARLDALADQEKSIEADREAIAARARDAESELAACSEEYGVEQERSAAVRSEASGSAEEVVRLTTVLSEAERRLRDASQRETQRIRRQLDRDQLVQRRQLHLREFDSLQRNLGDYRDNVAAAREAVDSCSEQLETLKSSAKQLVSDELAEKLAEDQEAKSLREVLSNRAALEGRERGVEETIQNLEGVSQAARAVLEARAKNLLAGEFALVGQVVQAEPGQALAIEVALGGAINDLIVDTEGDSKTAIEFLKQNRAGRATFQPLALMREHSASQELRTVLAQPGVIGVADGLVQCESKYRPVIRSLLGRCLIVQNLDVAFRVAKSRGWSKISTLEGELLHSSGAVTGGAHARQTFGVLQRKAELSQIRKQIDTQTATVQQFHANSRIRQERAVEIQSQLRAKREEISIAEEALSEAKSFLRQVEDELRTANRDHEKLERELVVDIPEAEPDPIPVAQFEAAREEALHKLSAKSADANVFETNVREADRRLQQAKLRLDTAHRRRDQETQAESLRARKQEGMAPTRDRILAILSQESERAQKHRAEADSCRASVAFLQAIKDQKVGEHDKESVAAQAARKSAVDVGATIHQSELQRTRAEARKFSALSRLAEEYSITESDLPLSVTAPAPDAPSLVSRLKRELRAMGDVNMGAIEAYERLTLRFDELNGQMQDILGGIREVEGSVLELDRMTREKFLTTFEAVRQKFATTFTRLFEGGEGNIELTDIEDVLGSGIDIQVLLPGKRRQPLNLLSGGEQSLCTTAFLFALLQVKPSPLVILDEVDAPLDGRNVERYATLLKELSLAMQFIVITHNPVTIEAADVWLGVTMQEPGVSKLIPTKFSGNLQSA